MTYDRHYNAEYYDLSTSNKEDIPFYLGFVDPHSRVLELGCGTGRVSTVLASHAAEVVGVDLSPQMLERARTKTGPDNSNFICADISNVQLHKQFDVIIAPFRVMQALQHDEQVYGLFEVIRGHLAPGGTAILNVFNPLYSREEMVTKWPSDDEITYGRLTLEGGDLLVLSDERKEIDAERQVLFPKLIYRRYRDGVLVHEHINPICMRYYYPDQFIDLIEGHGFSVTERWGGYDNEPYGQGPELVVAFR